MKKIVLCIGAILHFCGPTSNCHAAEDFPVCYWRLIDEGAYIYRHNMDHMNWREIREQRERNRTANERPKLLDLHRFDFRTPFEDRPGPSNPPMERAVLFIRDPDGRVSRMEGLPLENGKVRAPDDESLNGRYLLGGYFDLGEMDVDGDGRMEKVRATAKHFITHYKDGGRRGGNPAFFFDEEDMPFEIGPAISPAQSQMGGGIQSPHKRYDMLVRYRGRPLPGATVTVLIEGGGWQKDFTTDADGQFEIAPPDDRTLDREWQKLLYVATYHDREENTFNIATLPMVVLQNRPEWRSQAAGFAYWTIIAAVGCVLLIPGMSRRGRNLREKEMLGFRNYRIKED
jgi:hypothetical protein